MTVNHITERTELMDGLYQGIGISMFLQIVKSIQVHTVEAFCRMTSADKVFRRGKGRLAEKTMQCGMGLKAGNACDAGVSGFEWL